jgi:hypothetical protein
MSSRRSRVDRRQHVGHHAGIVVTQPIHATSAVLTSTVRITVQSQAIRRYSRIGPGWLSGVSCISTDG